MEINGESILQIHLRNLKKSKIVDSFIVATTLEAESAQVCAIARKESFDVYQGSLEDVLDRFYQASKSYEPDYIVRVTSDCPLIDPILLDEVIQHAIKNTLSYCSTSENHPDGVDVEVMKFSELEEAYEKAVLISDREHVTPYVKRKPSNAKQANRYFMEKDYSNIRFTVDEQSDFEAIKILIENLGSNARWFEYADFITTNESLFSNQRIIRNEGYLISLEKDK
jgi:spore coat polysaccharide biosynthesis protein SpsF (cytidylyltransferase family)